MMQVHVKLELSAMGPDPLDIPIVIESSSGCTMDPIYPCVDISYIGVSVKPFPSNIQGPFFWWVVSVCILTHRN